VSLPSLSDVATVGAILLAAVPVGLLLVALVNAWISVANERKRSQPIVIAHERGREPWLSKDTGVWIAAALAYITNDGEGNAFNVRFGVELHGVRHPFRMEAADPTTGDRQRILRKGERVPPEVGG
jgi:hypothetical protein